MEEVTDFIFLGFKITSDSDFSRKAIRRLLLGRKAMTNVDGVLKSRDITLLTEVQIVKAHGPLGPKPAEGSRNDNPGGQAACPSILLTRQPEGPPIASQSPGHPLALLTLMSANHSSPAPPFFCIPVPLSCASFPSLSCTSIPIYHAFILLLYRCFAPRSRTSSLVTSLWAALWLKGEHGYQVDQAGLRALVLTI